jgi:hypothetical protein
MAHDYHHSGVKRMRMDREGHAGPLAEALDERMEPEDAIGEEMTDCIMAVDPLLFDNC